jgi:TetR/AcrR family transcriptional regulator of autoinduction and epiphytic fitness
MRTEEENNSTRAMILEATEAIMREEGYAAVSSRRVAAKAGLKSQLVHYYFGTMDDLFLALYNRTGQEYFERNVRAMTADDPLDELWKLCIDRHNMELFFEFMALSNHREVIRKQLAAANQRTRSLHVALLTKALEDRGIPPEVCPAHVLSVLLSGVALALVTESAIGSNVAHADTITFIDQLIKKTKRQPTDKKGAVVRRKTKAGERPA